MICFKQDFLLFFNIFLRINICFFIKKYFDGLYINFSLIYFDLDALLFTMALNSQTQNKQGKTQFYYFCFNKNYNKLCSKHV